MGATFLVSMQGRGCFAGEIGEDSSALGDSGICFVVLLVMYNTF